MLTVFSPAKINLFLRVLGKREDGYHELSTLMQTIDLGDSLEIKLGAYDCLTCDDPSIPTDSSNLILKAARLFRQKTGVSFGLHVHLHKRIPIQAGLGGGSGNAATTLWAFNQLTGGVSSIEELQAWSADIGSDIPFFFSTGLAHCGGRGEKVSALPASPACVCQIVKPKIGLSTPDVYQRLKAEPLRGRREEALDFFLADELSFFNDLEQPAFEAQPALRQLKQRLLNHGFKTVLMTGSGSAFFCLGKDKPLIEPDLFVYTANFLNRESTNWYQDKASTVYSK